MQYLPVAVVNRLLEGKINKLVAIIIAGTASDTYLYKNIILTRIIAKYNTEEHIIEKDNKRLF